MARVILFPGDHKKSLTPKERSRKIAPMMKLDCACKPEEGKRCQFHARQPRPCPEKRNTDQGIVPCDGVLVHYSGKDGGVLGTFVSTQSGFAVKGKSRVYERPAGAARMCTSCDHCERA